jgi:hypothetical protein
MVLIASTKTRQGRGTNHLRLAGWPAAQTGPVVAPAEIILSCAAEPRACIIRLALDPASATLTATAAGGSLHYFRLADATLRPLPAQALAMSFARGDAYIALSPGARLLAGSPAIARFLHLRDGFNAERLAESVLNFLAQESGQAEFPEDVTALVVEAR